MKTRDRPVVSNGQTSSYLNQMNMTKWSIKERLYLISCVLINGDSNWTKICDQLNKWIKFTSSYHTTPLNITTRTNNQCSKQYKFLLNSYAKKNGTSDLKKIYNDLAEERLNELKNLVVSNQENFNNLSNEIEQMLNMDTSNFEELANMWKNVKKNQEYLKKQGTDIENYALYEDEEAELLANNLEKIAELQKKQEEREAALVIERQKALDAQKRLERAKAREAENKRKLAEQAELEKKKKEEEEKSRNEAKLKLPEPVTEIKTEPTKTSSNKIEMEDLFDKIRTSDMSKPIKMDKIQEKLDIGEESVKQKEKLESESTKTSTGIEWKPVIDTSDNSVDKKENIETTSSATTSADSEKKSSSSPNSSTDSDLVKKSRRNRCVIDSSSSSSQSSNGSSSDNDDEKKKEKSNEQNKLKTEETELIFTPLINYNKNESIENNKSLSSSSLKEPSKSSISEDEDETSESRRISPKKPSKSVTDNEKEAENGDKTKNGKGDKKFIETCDKNESNNEEEKSEEQTGRIGSLRSSNKNRLSSPLQSKRRSASTKLTKTGEDQSNLKNNNLLAPVNQNQNQNQIKDSDAKSAKSSDSGLLSIIKSEPVQISASSTITQEGSMPTDVNLSISTRSTRNAESVPAPFSSSSTSSSLSNNSFNSKFEDEKAYRSWKKSIMMVLNNITCHKHATIFMQPVRDEIAPGYSSVVFRPMDLTTIKKNIETGVIKSTKVFQRDIMLMFTNAIMYNSSNHDVHKISVEMYREVLNDVEQLLHAQENKYDDDVKPSRSKDKRSSTTSDRNVVIAGNDNESVESEAVVNILMKSTRKSSHNFSKDETVETASINSNSSVSTKTRGRVDSKISSPTTSVASTSNSKKRRPSSSESSQLKKEEQQMPEPKTKKRRRSGR